MKEIIEAVKDYKDFIFDMDGVIYNGENHVVGAKETIEKLRYMEKNVKFLTNFPESRKSVKERLKKVVELEASEEDIITAAYATALYMKNSGRSCFVIGQEDLKHEIRQNGINVYEADIMTEDNILKHKPDWVVISLCDKNFYEQANVAGQILKSNYFNSSHYIATSKGWGWTREHGVTPGIGCTIAFLKEFSGKEPVIIGKPSNYLTDLAFKEWGINSKDSLIVGDKWSDIQTANDYGVFGIKVETGKQDFFKGLEKLDGKSKPKLVLKSINGLFDKDEIIYQDSELNES